jgi:twitching motility two-component system response regulator PilH
MKNPVILIIDDDVVNRLVLESLLKKNHIQCIMAENGETGIQKAIKELPDIILLDIFMPDENGFDILSMIKENEQIKHIPVYIFSILENEADIQKAYDIGATGYITKPFDMIDVVEELKKVFISKEEIQ